MQPIRLIRGFLSVGAWTLASRVVGFIRDVMIAAYLGTGSTPSRPAASHQTSPLDKSGKIDAQALA